MHTLVFGANERRRSLKRRNDSRRETESNKATFFLSGSLLSATRTARRAPILTGYFKHRPRMPVKIILLEQKKPIKPLSNHSHQENQKMGFTPVCNVASALDSLGN